MIFSHQGAALIDNFSSGRVVHCYFLLREPGKLIFSLKRAGLIDIVSKGAKQIDIFLKRGVAN